MIGSNQYKTRKKHTVNGMIGAIIALGLFSLAVGHYAVIGVYAGADMVSDWARHTFITIAGDPVKLISPLAQDSGVVYADEKVNIRVVKSITETVVKSDDSVVKQVVKESLTVEPEENGQKTEIEAYIKTIFGKDAPTAIAIAKAESGLRAKANNTSKIETSIGVMQINIKSKTTLVHWARIPGETLEEKIKWLEEPKQNILLSYWIYTKSGFNPWSTYTNGAYLKYL